ncbi:hypothetical protein LMG19145_02211 [Xanthomonas arboricola pv. fragariae]|nr:hypothetical protein [Xanthomonas arboricola]SOU11100.1 hypothetical protein LMG19145_02211 [Xanthomonas arboricola pv. fragariae]
MLGRRWRPMDVHKGMCVALADVACLARSSMCRCRQPSEPKGGGLRHPLKSASTEKKTGNTSSPREKLPRRGG